MADSGFTKVRNCVIRKYQLKAVDLAVYVYISSFNPSYPPYKKIAADLGISESTVKRSIDRLVQKKLIEVNKRKSRSGRTTNLYEFLKPNKNGYLNYEADERGSPEKCKDSHQKSASEVTREVHWGSPEKCNKNKGNKSKEKEQDSSLSSPPSLSLSTVDMNNFIENSESLLRANNKIAEFYEYISESLLNMPQDKAERARNILAHKIKHQFKKTEKSQAFGEKVLEKVNDIFEQCEHEPIPSVPAVSNEIKEMQRKRSKEFERMRILSVCEEGFILMHHGTPENAIRNLVRISEILQDEEEESLLARYRERSDQFFN